jgi:xanthine dehydrogenase molybdopterin-binding subunit B
MTADDIPGDNIVSSLKEDMPALAAGVIRHHAEPVALVAAPDKATLREARRRIRLRTEPLEPVLDPLASSQQFAAYEIGHGDLRPASHGPASSSRASTAWGTRSSSTSRTRP